jgi:chlorobactene glucosyltransferase
MNTAIITVALSTVFMILGIALTRWLHSKHDMEVVLSPAAVNPSSDYPLISVIVPARNEERNIQHCIQALSDQTYPRYELIVVDDRSTDSTRQVLDAIDSQKWRKSSDFLIVDGKELPDGWAGKPHALVQGVNAARGEWLCFIDADTFASPELLISAYETAVRENADLLSLLTAQKLGSFWEKVVLPLVFVGLSFGFPADRVNDPHKPDAIANGQFILIKRSVYEAVGGHTVVKDRIDEDKAIAEAVKAKGFRLILADGRSVAVTRMYTSLGEMWEGWTKNIFLGLRDRLGLLILGVFSGIMGALALPVWLIGGTVWFLRTMEFAPAVVALQAAVVIAYLLYWRIKAAKAFQIHPAYSLTLPVGALMFTAMMLTSAYNVLSGRGVIWRGRRYVR